MALPDSGACRDALDGEAVEPDLGEELDRGLEDGLVGLGTARPAGAARLGRVATSTPPRTDLGVRSRGPRETMSAGSRRVLRSGAASTLGTGRQPHERDDRADEAPRRRRRAHPTCMPSTNASMAARARPGTCLLGLRAPGRATA